MAKFCILGWNRSWGLEYVLVEVRGTEPNPSHPYWRSLGFGFPRCCCRRRRRWRVWSRWCNPLQRAGTAPLRFYLSLWQTCCPACSTCTTPAAEGERTGGRMAELPLVMWAVPCPESCPLSWELSLVLTAVPCPQSCSPQVCRGAAPLCACPWCSGHTGDIGICWGHKHRDGRRMMLIISTCWIPSEEP